jgi:hypothetical protein
MKIKKIKNLHKIVHKQVNITKSVSFIEVKVIKVIIVNQII